MFYDPYGDTERYERRLPHWQQDGVFYCVTWRLADSLPKDVLDGWQADRNAWMRTHPKPLDEDEEEEYHQRFSEKLDGYLDSGLGSCVLRSTSIAGIVADAMMHFNGVRYDVKTFVVMPNHVHVLFRLIGQHRLENVVKSWKGFSARRINERLERQGTLWQEEYWDRMIRSDNHLARCSEYIIMNPVRANLGKDEFIVFGHKEGGFSNPP